MKRSVLSKEQQKQWQKLYSAAINGNPPWKRDFEKFSAKYSRLMKEKLVILEKWSKERSYNRTNKKVERFCKIICRGG